MATLVSPGVSVTVTDQSYFVPASAPTVPLIVLATRENKYTDSTNTTLAPGTQEYGVVRTITSLSQSQSTYGIPYFQTTNGQPNHGDARNEYGLAALNMALGQLSQAYVIRANVNLDDNFTDIQTAWTGDIDVAVSVVENLVNQWIASYNTNNQLSPSTPSTAAAFTIAYSPAITSATPISKPSAQYTATVTIDGNAIPVSIDLSTTTTVGAFITALNTVLGVYGTASILNGNIVITSATVGTASTVIAADIGTTYRLFGDVAAGVTIPTTAATGTNGYAVTIDHTSLYALIQQAVAFIWLDYSFGIPTTPTTLKQDFLNDQTTTPLPVYSNGFTSPSPTTGNFIGILGMLNQWYADNEGGTVPGQFTAAEAGNLLTQAGDEFEWTNNFLFKTALGTDDASRRAAIVQALNAIIVSNQDIRAETIEYNLILTPGYPECVSNMQALVVNYLKSEVLVIGDTPMGDDPDDLATWAASSSRVIDVAGNVCYYYPHVLTTNLDGTTIMVPSSAQALTTMAYSDNVSYEWFAPAGVNRGKIVGISDIGYYTGTPGTATTFVTLHPNQGQRDVLYAYTASGGMNPLVYFPGNGFLVWGQKTSTGTTASALDRINVSRLVKYIARSLRKAALAFVFEPNDTLTQNNLKTMVDSFLGNLVTQRGLYDFASVCDSSNNTPAVVDANELIIDVAIKPVKAAEFIYIPITIVATGASLNTAGASQSVG
jgi:hypothetical protein